VPDPFISVQDVIDYLGRGGTADPGMIIATDSACDTVRALAERDFNAGTATVVLDGSGTDAMLIPNRYLPVTAAGTVTVAGSAVTDYALNDNGVLFRRGTAATDCLSLTWPVGRQNVAVTISYGYPDADLPRDVRMVALSLAARLVVQGPAAQESIGQVSIRYGVNATDLTNGELRILAKYRQTR